MNKEEQLEDIYRNSIGIDKIMYDLGSYDFIQMTGCYDFFTDSSLENPWLRMTIPKNPGNVNRLEITLSPDDTYRMEFYKMSFTKHPEGVKTNVSVFSNLEGAQLKDTFKLVTGLDVIMPKIIKTVILDNIEDHLQKESFSPTEGPNKKLKL